MALKKILGALLVLAGATQVQAQELRIGTQGDPSLDPHYMYIGTNVSIFRHLFGTLTMHDQTGKILPSLAASYRAIDDKTWEFKLRPDVKFKDGSVLTADDVVFSLKRAAEIPGNPSPYTSRLESIVGVEAPDPQTVLIRTSAPNPYVPDNMVDMAIVSRKSVEGKATGDFTSLKAMNEYGPYRVVSFTPGDRLVLERNPTFWGDKPYWEKVTFRVMTNDATRVAALLSGDVDFIDFVPPSDVPKLKANPKIAVQTGPSTRMMFLLINFRTDAIPTNKDADGKPLDKNPLLDLRVRQALSKSIDRKALVSRIMDGEGVPASQVALPIMEGYDPKLEVDKYDPQGAKKLLAEAGYPKGFGLTIACSNNRYPNDDKVCQAVGQMLSRGGFNPSVETVPMSILMPKLRGTPERGSEIALGMLGLGSQGTTPKALTLVMHSINPSIGRGQYNFGRYSNAEFDRAVIDATTTLDQKQRDAKMRTAMDLATRDVAALPLFFLNVITASRADLTYSPDPAEETLAWLILPKNK